MTAYLNKGAIYKVQASEKGVIGFIRLERNVKIDEKEYNIFIYEEEKTQTAQKESHENASKEPCAKLLPIETQFSFAWTFPEVTSLLGKKLCFEIENVNEKDAKPPYKISSVECEYEG